MRIRRRLRQAVARTRALFHKHYRLSGYRALAAPDKIVHLGVDDIAYHVDDKVLRGRIPAGAVLASFPDLETFTAFRGRDRKIDSVVRHFTRGVPWRETELFTHQYAERLTRENVRGFTSLAGLEDFYKRVYDPLFEDLRRNGIDASGFGDRHEPLLVHISKDGEFIWCSTGKHRLAMCLVLGIDPVPVRVHARHRAWQERREAALEAVLAGRPVPHEIAAHPDMQDIVGPEDARLAVPAALPLKAAGLSRRAR